jgi:hypothetical protein
MADAPVSMNDENARGGVFASGSKEIVEITPGFDRQCYQVHWRSIYSLEN